MDAHITDLLQTLLSRPSELSLDDLRRLNAELPYFPLPAMTMLAHHADSLSPDETTALQSHLAVITGDKKALFNILGDDAARFAALYPADSLPKPSKPTTASAIDMFFANYGSASDAETRRLEQLIFNPVPEYAELLLADATPDELSPTDGIDIPATPLTDRPTSPPIPSTPVKATPPTPTSPPPSSTSSPPPPPDDAMLSQSLAKIFIKQGRYRRAYEIISNLSLNYPKKSIYFADQLRFLQKLIQISEAAQGEESKNL